MSIDRRHILRTLGLGAAAALVPVGRSGWAAPGGVSGKRLIVVFLRGAVDGLNVVVPHGEPAYYAARPGIAVKPGPGGVIDLDGHFGLHPALAPPMPLWQQGSLGFVHAAGSPDPNRSHFDAQAMMEAGTPGNAATRDGWMNRLLAVLPGPHAPTQGIAFGPVLPRIMSGKVMVSNMEMGKGAARPTALDRAEVSGAFGRLYGGQDAMSQAYRQGQDLRHEILSQMSEEEMAANGGAPLPNGFPGDAGRIARLVARDPGIQLVFLALGGWDTHVNQGNAKGQLAGRLQPLGDGLAALVNGLGQSYRDTVILVISEFGRTVKENGNAGTDHGHGNVMWVLGGGIAGGKIWGDWPGLSPDRLYQGRDLAVTTDFRTVIAGVLERHLRLSDRDLATVFPAMPHAKTSFAGIVKA